MKTVTYLVCLLLLLLNGTAPSDASSLYSIDSLHSFLHFEKDNHHYPGSPVHFQIIATDETNDSADSENEDSDPSSFKMSVLSTSGYRTDVLHYTLRSRAHSRSAKAHVPLIVKAAPLYIEQGVLRI